MRTQVQMERAGQQNARLVEGIERLRRAPPTLTTIESAPEPPPVGIFQDLVDALSQQAALLDVEDWTILAVNNAWKQTMKLPGYDGFGPGSDYRAEVEKIALGGSAVARNAVTALDEIRQHKRTSFRMVYNGASGQEGKRFEARYALMKVGGREYLRVTRYDITELMQLRSMRNGFSAKVMKAQEEERRRMGREIHDTGMQLLAGLSLSLARLKQAKSEKVTADVITDMEGLLFEAQREFRSISFLAHPPQIERLGLVEALRGLVEGFAKRASLKASFGIEGDFEIPSADVEHTIFRMVQEGLSNVHRHARASKLVVRLIGRERMLHVIVADNGRGISADLQHGVGLQGMRSRLRELGGRLTIRNGSPGTILAASLPVEALAGPQ